jgi:hypothetical protein
MGKLYIPAFSNGRLKKVFVFEEGEPTLMVRASLEKRDANILKFPLRNKQGSGTDNVVDLKSKLLEKAIAKFEAMQKDPTNA